MKWTLHRHALPDLSYEGDKSTEIETLCDIKLQTGEAESVDRVSSDGTSSSQYLPSYCKNGWPHCCQGCDCANA